MHNFYQGGRFVMLRVLLPAWAITYFVKYHVQVRAGPEGVKRNAREGAGKLWKKPRAGG